MYNMTSKLIKYSQMTHLYKYIYIMLQYHFITILYTWLNI